MYSGNIRKTQYILHIKEYRTNTTLKLGRSKHYTAIRIGGEVIPHKWRRKSYYMDEDITCRQRMEIVRPGKDVEGKCIGSLYGLYNG